MARLLLLGPAREAAGVSSEEIEGANLDSILQEAVQRYGTAFEKVLSVSQIWVNGEPAEALVAIGPRDEIAVLPPISGG
jgi:molybdopterin converting factor small subunit